MLDKSIDENLSKLIETPYEEGGRTEKGCDCWGLVLLFYKYIFEINLPEYTNIYLTEKGNFSDTSSSIEEIKSLDFKQVDFPQFGDIIIINLLGRPIHIGVIIDKNTMIHTARKTGAVIEKFSGVKWEKRIMGYYRPITN